jgi:hypothetical protein
VAPQPWLSASPGRCTNAARRFEKRSARVQTSERHACKVLTRSDPQDQNGNAEFTPGGTPVWHPGGTPPVHGSWLDHENENGNGSRVRARPSPSSYTRRLSPEETERALRPRGTVRRRREGPAARRPRYLRVSEGGSARRAASWRRSPRTSPEGGRSDVVAAHGPLGPVGSWRATTGRAPSRRRSAPRFDSDGPPTTVRSATAATAWRRRTTRRGVLGRPVADGPAREPSPRQLVTSGRASSRS